jgi:hypothetical protein
MWCRAAALTAVLLLARPVATATVAAGATGEPASFLPQWKPGDTWAVRTVHMKMDFHDTRDPIGWLPSYVVRYRVAARQQDGARTIYKVAAHAVSATGPADAVLTLVAENGRLAVSSVRSSETGSDDPAARALLRDGGPAFSTSALLPLDVPAFPLQPPRSDAPPRVDQFERAWELGGLKFSRAARQRVEVRAPERCQDATGSSLKFLVPPGSRPLIRVVLNEEGTGAKVLQYWAEGHPWFLYSETGSARSWLAGR